MFSLIFALLSSILYANVKQVQTQSFHEDLGNISLYTKIGNVANKYQPLKPADVTATKNAVEATNLLKIIITTGFGPLPVLDPYRQASIGPIDFGAFSSFSLMGTVYLKNLVIIGARNFSLNELQIRLSNHRTDFNVTFPKLCGETDFTATVYYAALPFNFNGHVRLTAHDVNVAGAVGAAKTRQRVEVFKLVATEAKLTARDVRISISDPKLIDALSTLMGKATLRGLFDDVKSDIFKFVAKLALQQANDVLQNVTAQELLKYLLSY